MTNIGSGREIWIDWMRVTACFFVMLTHCCEPFYLGGEGSLILTRSDAIWVSVLNVLPRAAVALFIIASSYLQFPLHYQTGEFFRWRAARVLVPFLFWTVVYALVWGEPVLIKENRHSNA
ncbi:MAG: acyltransferase family protein [Bacteroidales bacterium]|nr:acyltransferase family protein [Bacteroidales bacterium]